MEENIQEYEFDNDNRSYKLITSIINGLYIKIICHPKNHKYGYINHFSKIDLIQINSIFTYYNNITQILQVFNKCIENQKVSIFHNRTFFNIYFYILNGKETAKIPLPLFYENEFILSDKPKNIRNSIFFNELDKELLMLEKKQENMRNKINEIILELNNEEKKNINLNNKNKIYFNERKTQYLINSSILKTSEEYNLIKNKLLSQRKSKITKRINYQLLYKASKDTDKTSIFHNKCDNKRNTIIFIETNEGKKFGGFTTQTWEGNTNKKDENAFLFSLDKLKIYDIIKERDAIICNLNYGPMFGGGQIIIFDKFFKEGGKTGKAHENYNTEEDYELNNGNMIFQIKELEVFEILF